jgi:hypothetical protein
VGGTSANIDTSVSAESSWRPQLYLLGRDQPPHLGSALLGEASDVTLNLDSHLGVFPAASVATGTPKDFASPTSDLISQGVIDLAAAEELFAYFLEHLNHYLHGILRDSDTLASVRARSSILTAAICTVAAICSAPDAYSACYDAFVGQVSELLFATRSSYDDVRALCIAALWLDNIGPTLSGLGKIDMGS